MPDSRTHSPACGFSLIELIVVFAIIVVLAGLSLGGVAVVRWRAATYEAEQVVRQLHQALETYRTEDGRHRYPLHEQLYPTSTLLLPLPHLIALTAQGSAAAGVLGLLDAEWANQDQRTDREELECLEPCLAYIVVARGQFAVALPGAAERRLGIGDNMGTSIIRQCR